MSVYVDNPLGLSATRGGWCHMVADSLEELHEFAGLLKLDRKWFQPRSWPHYDLSPHKRALAIEHGAKPVTGRDLIAILKATYAKP